MQRTNTCDHCGQAKPATETHFAPNLRNRDRLATYCRQCSPQVAAERRRRKAERSRVWAQNNPEKVKQSAQQSYDTHRAKRLAYYRRWRQANKDKVQAYQSEYRERKRREAQ